MLTATISFTKASDIESAIAIINKIDPAARVFFPEPKGSNYIEFDLTDKINASAQTFVEAANEQGRGPFIYQVCIPA